MKLRSAPVLGCLTLLLTLAMDYRFDCKDIAGGGLMDALWYTAAVKHADEGDAELQGEIDGLENQVNDLAGQVGQAAQGQPGAPGADGDPGLSCWDLNGNGKADADEDINGDGVWDALDCQGATGAAGKNGINCWDLNGNGRNDPAEDVNGDGVFNALDCAGADGKDGADCWDHVGDVNGDGTTDWKDCVAFAEGDGDDDGIIARAVIDEWGYVRPGGVSISGEYGGGSTRFGEGQYMLNIDLSDVRADLNNVQPIDFPVFVTVRATSASNLPWEDDISGLVAHYRFERFDGQPALDVANKRLSMQVFVIRALDGKLMSAKFSVLVFEPEP